MNTEKYHEMESLEKFHWWFVYRQNIIRLLLGKYLKSLSKDAQIVDIGCGTGGNLSLLSEYFSNLKGVDNNAFAIEYCRGKNLENIFQDELPNLKFIEDGSADLLLLFDVLEHIDDDKAALAELRRKLKPGGYLLATVPAFSFLWSKHDESFHHKRRYEASGLKKLFLSEHFEIIKSSYLYFLLFLPVCAMRSLKKVLKSYSEADDFKVNNRFLNFLMIKFLALEEFLLRFLNLPFGSSILILARKNSEE